jgi:hypothetical protein
VDKPGSIAEALRLVARWLDLADDAFYRLADLNDEDFVSDNEVQLDLLSIASYLDTHWSTDREIYVNTIGRKNDNSSI